MISSENNNWWAAHRTRYTLICLAAATAAYINSFWGTFQLDDYDMIVLNPAVHSWSAFAREYFHGIRPVLKLTYLANWLGPAGTFGFHVTNLGIHLINTLLVFHLTNMFLGNLETGDSIKARYPIAFLTAIFFGLHPIQTEAVTYITGRSASLMTLFYLGSVAAYAHGSHSGKKFWYFFISPLLFILGVATKEAAITLPFALVLYEIAQKNKDRFKRIFTRLWVHFGLLGLLIIIVLTHPRYRLFLLYSFDLRGFKENLAGQINGAGDLLLHLVAPWRLNIDPGTVTPVSFVSIESLLIFLLVAASVIAFIRDKPWVWFGMAWFFLNIAIVVIVPRTDIISDRHFYPASWGIFMAASSAIVSYIIHRPKSLTIFILITVLFSGILGGYTIARNRDYSSEVALWKDTVAKSPSNARAYNNLGYAYYLMGCENEAREAYLRALEIDPSLEHAQNNIAMLGQGLKPAKSCK